MSRWARWLGWALICLMLVLLPQRATSTTFAARLLGPIASLTAGWQWVRVRQALEEGRPGLAYSRAELALELDPSSTGAWSFLASHYAHDRASPDAEPNAALRTSWVRAALTLLERGEASAREPAELALHRGLLLVHVGDFDGAIPWPGGPGGAWLGADSAFERAIELDPGGAAGWVQLARLRALRLASAELEPSTPARLAALESSLELLRRGSAHARRPAELAFEEGLLMGITADEAQLGEAWPGGRAALYADAIRAFEAAELGGVRLAHDAAESARAALEALDS
jgi:hypothetical protein